VRARFEERFSATRMAAEYVKLYRKQLRKRPAPERHLQSLAGHSITRLHAQAETGFQNEAN